MKPITLSGIGLMIFGVMALTYHGTDYLSCPKLECLGPQYEVVRP